MFYTIWRAALCTWLCVLIAAQAQAAIPRYDHVVVVVMENHRLAQVVGNAAAPYITGLSLQGANFTNAHGVSHPSQPNYLALFSGSTQGVISDRCPQAFSKVDNLGAQLIAAGLSFSGYAEAMPWTGYQGCADHTYRRKHNPWVNFSNVPDSANRPFSAFPDDFTLLPTVAFVVPDMVGDMHDSDVQTGDAWLARHIDAYAQWAKSHNSLLLLTFDEDDYGTASNLIPTIMVGAGVMPGNYGEQISHYNVLATIESMYGLALLTPAAPVTAVFAAQAPPGR
jgi:hypothetical protein